MTGRTNCSVEVIFRKGGGSLRMSEAIRQGVHRDTLRQMVAEGRLEKVDRGLYSLPGLLMDQAHPDLAVVGKRVPSGVVCLVSALAFHGLTTRIPQGVDLAIRPTAATPRMGQPPVRVFRFGGRSFEEGVETHGHGPFGFRVYSREKTLADCFKFRRVVGLDTCLEALRKYRDSGRFDGCLLEHHAGVCRVSRVMRPYLEAIV
jgi:predicted transcriptional regulator of viral defense system